MGIKWNELTSTDPKDAWCLISVEIAKELFDSQMIIVPRLEEAPFFDLMVCFTKGCHQKKRIADLRTRSQSWGGGV